MNRLVFFSAILLSGNIWAQARIPRSKLESPEVHNYEAATYSKGDTTAGLEYSCNTISMTTVLDEARILKVEGTQVFFEVILKSHISEDQPLSQLSVYVNGYKVYPENEETSVLDYDCQSERQVVNLVGNPPTQVMSTENVTTTFKVVERKISFSYTYPKKLPSTRIVLRVYNKISSRENYFEWHIVD